MTELERELRWAREGRDAAEKAEARMRKELESFVQFQDNGVRHSSLSPPGPRSVKVADQ
jgi:hypothetical protein